MKKKIILFCLSIFVMTAEAQTQKMYIYQQGRISAYNLEGIDSLVFAEDNIDWMDTDEIATLVDDFYNDTKGLAVEGLFGRELMWEQGAANDMVWGRTRGYPQLATLSLSSSVVVLRDSWNRFYGIITSANQSIQVLTRIPVRTPDEDRMLGEAYFMRALAHFYLAYRYGTAKQGVPFVRYEDFANGYDGSVAPQLASVTDNYQFVIDDFEKAEELLPTYEEYDEANFGRAHKAAAVGYMAKVYAYWACWDSGKWSNVIDCVDKLETAYGRDLTENFTDNFTSDQSKWDNKEYLFSLPSLRYNNEWKGCEFPGVVVERMGWGAYNGWGQFKPTLDIYEEFAKDDARLADGQTENVRKVNSLLEYGQSFQFFGSSRRYYSSMDVESGFMIAKYLEPFTHANAVDEHYVNSNGDWPVARMNFPLLRFADCLLLRAEAYLAQGNAAKATTDINKIRERAKLQTLTDNATWTDLYHERRVELAFEFTDHLYDLKRWAVSGADEIKAIAVAELEAHPRVRHYTNRSNPDSDFTIGDYLDYQSPAKVWEEWKMVFPYNTVDITNSGGAWKQNEGYD